MYSSLGSHDGLTFTWWKLPIWVLWISGALIVVALLLRNARWENKLTLLLLMALAAALYGLVDTELTMHAVAAALWGLIGMLAIWLVHAMLGWRSAELRPQVARAPGTAPADLRPVVPVIPPAAMDEKDGGSKNA